MVSVMETDDNRPCILDVLPSELIDKVLGNLSVSDLATCLRVCRTINSLASNDTLYMALLRRDFGVDMKRRIDLSWKDLYRRVFELDLSGLWVDRGSSNLNDGYPDVEFPLNVCHVPKKGLILGGGVFPAQSLWEVGLPFKLHGTVKGVKVEFDITWPFGYGHSVLSGAVDPEDDDGSFSGTWVTFPSDASAGQINRGRFVSQRKSRQFDGQFVQQDQPAGQEQAGLIGGIPGWALGALAGEAEGGAEVHPVVVAGEVLPAEETAMEESSGEEEGEDASSSDGESASGGGSDDAVDDAPDAQPAGQQPGPASALAAFFPSLSIPWGPHLLEL